METYRQMEIVADERTDYEERRKREGMNQAKKEVFESANKHINKLRKKLEELGVHYLNQSNTLVAKCNHKLLQHFNKEEQTQSDPMQTSYKQAYEKIKTDLFRVASDMWQLLVKIDEKLSANEPISLEDLIRKHKDLLEDDSREILIYCEAIEAEKEQNKNLSLEDWQQYQEIDRNRDLRMLSLVRKKDKKVKHLMGEVISRR